MKACFQIAECSLSYTKIMQTSAMKAAFKLPSAAYLIQRYDKISHATLFAPLFFVLFCFFISTYYLSPHFF